MDTNLFIQKAKEIHKDKYDYSKTIYTGPKNKVIIICPEHGQFEQAPYNHLRGSGCNKCAKTAIANAKKISKEEFIKRSVSIHGDKYIYDKLDYDSLLDKVIITCPKHGDFVQKASSHLEGCGCPKCKNCKKLTTEEFIEKASTVHNNKYSYDKSVYISSRTKLLITCPTHGDFSMQANNHLAGQGCPACSSSKGELAIAKYLQDNGIKYQRQYLVKLQVNNSPYNAFVDFYLPDLNIYIEYNGQQHYMPIECFGGKLSYEKQILRDEALRNYCQLNDIKLVEIKYSDNITNILNNLLQ